MTSYRNHRVVIATLFLPTTVVLRESPYQTPKSPTVPLPATSFKIGEKPTHVRTKSNVPLKSIVEDLKDKTSRTTTPQTVATPGAENANPFLNLNNVLVGSPTHPSPPRAETQIHQHQTTHTGTNPQSSRLQRRFTNSLNRQRSSSSHSFRYAELDRQVSPLWHIEPNPHCNGGLKNAIHSMQTTRLKRKLWVGTLGTHTDGYKESLKKEVDLRMRDECESIPVWIPDGEFEKCYDEFCHQVLWPALHYAIPDAPKTKSFYESASYSQYLSVNKRFADAIVANYQEGDIIWVNDYHLMLLPNMIRQRLPNATIGFFLHVAFPSSEIFRCLSVRESLLRGVLAADLVTFQTPNFARHFRQTVSRILALEALPKGIQTEDRFVDVAAIPMGIDVNTLSEKRREAEVAEWVNVLRQRYAGMKIIVGRDKLDEIQGVRQKMQAFEAFLDKYTGFRGKIVLIQVALQTTEENELQGRVADVVSRINSRFSTLTYQPVVFLHTQDLTFSQYLALLTVADAFLVASLREGMALRGHEFVECQEERKRPLILSEFTGSYTYSGFRSCIPINPWDKRNTAEAIHTALTMSDEEANSRWLDLHRHVIAQTAQAFVNSFLSRCLRAYMEHQRGIETAENVAHFDVSRVLPEYKYSSKRLLLIDLEDTLWTRKDESGIIKQGTPFTIPEPIFEILNKLAEDRRNEVWVLSGLPIAGAMDAIAEKAPRIGLIAENGCFIKTLATREQDSQWVNVVANFNLTWKSACMEILNYFTERTPGSYIEEREATIVWRFWSGRAEDAADRQWALRQAAEAQNHIFDSLGERYGLRIIPGTNSFLVLPNNVSRSSAVGAILHPGGPARSLMAGRSAWSSADVMDIEGTGNVDFVLVIGSDEKLLRRMNEIDNAETCSTSPPNKGTDAKWRMQMNEVVDVLLQFANVRY